MNVTSLEHTNQWYQHRLIWEVETEDALRSALMDYGDDGFRVVAMTCSPDGKYVVIMERPGITRDEDSNDGGMRYR